MRDPATASPTPSPPPPARTTRAFGRFELRRLLGKSVGSMVWLAFDPRAGREVMLTLPRVQPADAAALERWSDEVRSAARLVHPNLVPVTEVGVQDQWPFIVADREHGVTLGERLAESGALQPADCAAWIGNALQGLAYAHEAGAAHHDLQLHSLVLGERGTVRVMALGAAGRPDSGATGDPNDAAVVRATEPQRLREAQREAAGRDVLTCGLLLYRVLAAQAPLEEPDTALVAARMAPLGREQVRLPWITPLPVPEALRAIVNRATSGQPRLRYHAARTLWAALDGWRKSNSQDGGGPVAVLLDRLQTVGHLPALPGLDARVTRVTSLESQRTDEIADEVLQDLALSFELLRTLNSSQVQGTQAAGNGPMLTLRRVIALIGVNGVRLAANTLREWPGPLAPPHAAQLKLALGRVRLAGHTAQALSPAGYDPQVVFLITVLQSLGRLMLRYHFADEAEQMQLLMAPTPADPVAATPAQPGLGESAAAFAVLGVDLDTLGTAVARSWGLSDDVLHMTRRLAPDAPVRRPDGDPDVLRLTANAANEAVDVVASLPAARAGAALARVAQRHARALGIETSDLADALQTARDVVRRGLAAPANRAANASEPAAATDAAPTSPVAATPAPPLVAASAAGGRAAGAFAT